MLSISGFTFSYKLSNPAGSRVQSVTLNNGAKIDCDYLACGFGLVPNTELASLLGCRMSGDFVAVDERDGTTLWHFPANSENKASPMTFTAGGKQFVTIATGPNIICFSLR